MNTSDSLQIQGGFHPLIKQLKNSFINNDLKMLNGENFHIITGPNMGGKSTFLRQNAIIIILSQIGSPVPAHQANIGIVDNLFTRIGSDDNLLSNESTFMVEMKEMKVMIEEATHKSFLVIDELGRGTSIRDGLAIAQSMIEYFNELKCSCLFSTHFHDLYKNLSPKIKYYYCDYYFNPHIIFTYKIVEGITKESFGIHVAELAGISKSIIDKAKQILNKN
jgi:DNA mismatch repair protein MutS